jgi:hypothetical protein
MKNAVHALFLVDGLLYLSKERDRSVDSVGGADDANTNVFPTCCVCLAVGAERTESGTRINASLLVCKQKFRFRQVGACEPVGALRK